MFQKKHFSIEEEFKIAFTHTCKRQSFRMCFVESEKIFLKYFCASFNCKIVYTTLDELENSFTIVEIFRNEMLLSVFPALFN